MNDKEYTYDIGKYTIGVDTNGEDGIGLTVAKVENGEINFLGNCYGENARCLDLLIKENQELKLELSGYRQAILNDKEMLGLKEENDKLKKQLEDTNEELELVRCDLHNRTSERDGYYRNIEMLENQQKEFIKWLENYLELFDYDNIDEQAGYDMIEEILQKYKEIIGGKDENN